MSTLKWSNVTGTSTDAGSASLKNAGSLFSKAFENFSGAVEDRQKRVTKENTDQLLNQIRGFGSVEDFDAQADQFSDLEGRKAAAGGFLDTSAISKALAAKRPELIQTGRTEEKFQRGEDARILTDAINQIPNQVLDANQPGSAGALDFKGQSASVRQQVRDLGGTTEQGNQAVNSMRSVLNDRATLSPEGQIASQQNAAQQEILFQQQSKQLTNTRDEIFAKNPISHTLNAEGNAISMHDLTQRARTDYPSTTSIPWGGAGGDTLTKMMSNFTLNGITSKGATGTKVGDKYSTKTRQVKPWMISMALDATGQTSADAWGNPTVANNFNKILAQIAFDPTYDEMEARYNRAKRQHDSGQTQLQLNKLRQGAQFTKDIKSHESSKLIQQLQNATR